MNIRIQAFGYLLSGYPISPLGQISFQDLRQYFVCACGENLGPLMFSVPRRW